MRHRQETEDRKKEKATRERGKEYLSYSGTKDCLWIEETDMAHRKMTVYKGTRGKPMLG